jgi:glycerophosphoryl diester phosphodiesterase
MKIIAHRGFSSDYPENTLLAFEKALEARADGIETDLQLSRDEAIILFHDDGLKRITGTKGRPQERTLTELKTLDAGRGERIPTLDELLQLCHAKATLILEIKYDLSTYKRLCELVCEQIAQMTAWVEVSCFEDRVLEYIHQLNPRIRLHKLIDSVSTLQDKDFEKRYHYASYFDIDVKLSKTALELGIIQRHKVIFWTVQTEDITTEKEAGLYGIMKNDPTS